MTGRVTSVREFGAFVDLGAGVQGLLHVSEMGWSRVSDTSQVVKPGDEITVKVLRVDDDKQKISLGLKQLTADPWSSVHETYEVGQVRTGRVTRVAEFGAFVELEPGVEGLAHASTFAPTGRSEGWSDSVAPEMTAAFEILSIDLEKKRIGVALVPEGSARAGGAAPSPAAIVPGARLTGKVERHEKFGVFVFLAPGRTGLIPLSETGVAKEADVARAFPVGADVEVVVLEVDASGRRIRLSAKAVLDAHEAEEVREYTERGGCGGGKGSDRSPTSSAARSSRGRSERAEHSARVAASDRQLVLGGGRGLAGRQPHAVGAVPPLSVQALHHVGPRVRSCADDRARGRPRDVDHHRAGHERPHAEPRARGPRGARPRGLRRVSRRGGRRMPADGRDARREMGARHPPEPRRIHARHARPLDAQSLWRRGRARVGRGAHRARPSGALATRRDFS